MGGSKKRRETELLRSSSLTRDSILATKNAQQTTQHVSVGCMSGIFQFVSKYHTPSKFLTYGKKPEREATKKPSQKPKNPPSQSENPRKMSPKITLEVPRSPSIPAEIRRPPPPTTPSVSPTAAEKRRKLLGALEKCDEDLQALRRVIESVRGVHTPVTATPCKSHGVAKEEEEEEESDEPSPVSVLDSRYLDDRTRTRTTNRACPKRTREEKGLDHSQQQQLTRHRTSTKRTVEEDNIILQSLHIPAKNRPQLSIVLPTTTHPTSRWSSATRECVIEVCKAVELGQRVELANVVLLLEDIMFRDLVDDVIKDMDWSYNPRHCTFASKRKLSF